MPPINDIDVILQDPNTVRLLKLNTNNISLSATSPSFVIDSSPNALTLTGVTYNTATRTFTCTNVGITLAVNDRVLISGTNSSGTPLVIPGYSTSGKYYYIVSTNGSTTFQLSNSVGGSVLTTTGSGITGLSFSIPKSIAITARLNGILRGSVVWNISPAFPYILDVLDPNKIHIKIEDVLTPTLITQFSISATIANFLGNSYSDQLNFYNVNSAASIVISDIVPDNRQIVTNSDGTGAVYTNATTTYTINSGGNSILDKLTSLIVTPSTGVKFTYTTNTSTSAVITAPTTSGNIATSSLTSLQLAVTDLGIQDSGTLTISAIYSGVTYTQVFTVTKNKNGADAVVYEIEPSSEISFNELTNTFAPSTVVYTAYKTVGFGPRQELRDANAQIKLERSDNNSTYVAIGTTQNLTTSNATRTLTTTVDATNFPDTTRYVRATLLMGFGSPVVYATVDTETENISINGFSPVVADISPDNRQVVTKSDGTNGVYTNATTTYSIFKGSTNIIGNLTSLIITPSTGVKFTYTTNIVSSAVITAPTTSGNIASSSLTSLQLAVTDLVIQDSGTLAISAIYRGVTYTQVFTVTKNKNGVDAIIYEIEADNEIVYDLTSNSYIPASVKYTAYKTTGTNLRQALVDSNARIVLERSDNNSTYTAVTGSPQVLTSTSFLSLNTAVTASFPNTTRYIRATLEINSAGVWTPVDVETDNITINGASPIVPRLSNDNEEVVTNNDGSGGNYSLATSTYTIFQGSTNIIGSLNALTIVPSPNVTFTSTRNGTPSAAQTTTQTITVIGLTSLSVAITNITTASDSGTLTINASYNGIVHSIVFSVSKNKNAESAIVYAVEPNNEIIYRPNNSTVPFAPSSIIYSAYKTVGFGFRQAYVDSTGNSRIRLERSDDAVNWSQVVEQFLNSSSTATLSTAVTTNFPISTRYIRASLDVRTSAAAVWNTVDTQTNAITTDGIAGVSPVVADITNDSQPVATSSDGTGGDYSLAKTNFTIFQGITNLLPNLTSLTITPSSLSNITYSYTVTRGGVQTTVSSLTAASTITITSDLTALSIAITNLASTIDSGNLTIAAVYSGQSYSQQFSVVKNKGGAAAAIYEIEANNEITLTKANVFTPSTVTYTAYKITGNSNRQALFPGTSDVDQFRIRLQRSSDNSTWTSIGTDLQLTTTISSRTLTTTVDATNFPVTTRYIRAILLRSTNGVNGTYSEVDVETDNITVNGIDGLPSISAFLTNPTHDLIANSSGVISTAEYNSAKTTFKIYEGTTDVSGSYIYTFTSSDPLNFAISQLGNVFTVSTLTADSAYVDITATRATYPNIILRFSVTRKKAAVNGVSPIIVDLTGAQIIQYNSDGSTPSPTSITFTANTKNVASGTTTWYRFYVDGTVVSTLSSTNNTALYTYTSPIGHFTAPKLIKVEISDTSTFTTILDDDVLGVGGIKQGSVGTSVDIVFKRAAAGTAPTISGTTNPPTGWYDTVAAAAAANTTAGHIIWASTGTLSGITWSWNTPVPTEGTTGTPGTSVDIVFQRAAAGTAPTISGTTNPPTGWYDTVAAAAAANTAAGLVIWASTGTLSGTAWSWNTPIQAEAASGNSISEVSIYTRSNSSVLAAPGGPGYSQGSVAVATNGTVTVTPPLAPDGVTWFNSIAGINSIGPVWESRTVAVIPGQSGTDTTLTWSTPVRITADGAKSVQLASTATTFNFNADGSWQTGQPNSFNVTLTVQNISAPWYWTVQVNNGVEQSVNTVSSGNTTIVAVNNIDTYLTFSSLPFTYTVRVYDSAVKTNLLAINSIGFIGYKQAAGATPPPFIDIVSLPTTIKVNTTAQSYNPASFTVKAVWTNIVPTTITWTSNASRGTPTSTTTDSTVTLTPAYATVSTGNIWVQASVTDGTRTVSKRVEITPVQDGAPGQVGSHGMMSALVTLYRWTNSTTVPSKPTGFIYYWNSGTYDGNARKAGDVVIRTNTSPAWYTNPADAFSNVSATQGWYLWELSVPLTEPAATWNTTTTPPTLVTTNLTTVTYSVAPYIAYNPAITNYLAIDGPPGSGTGGAPNASNYVIVKGALAAPTNAEVLASAVQRNPVLGDVATVVTNSTGTGSKTSYRCTAINSSGVATWTEITNFFAGDIITGGSIAANKLNIGVTTGNDRITIYDNKIEIWNAGVLRVKLGYLL